MSKIIIGECDCCGKKPVELCRTFYCGIETHACVKCRGEDALDYSGESREMGDDFSHFQIDCIKKAVE